MKTPLLSISFVSFLIISLAFLLSFLQGGTPGQSDFPDISGFIFLKNGDGGPSNLSSFEKRENERGYELTYGWKDYQSVTHFITFSISKQQLAEAEGEFGYDEQELEKHMEEAAEKIREEMIAYIREFAAQLIAKSQYSEYILIEEIDSKSFRLKLSARQDVYDRVKTEFEKIKFKIAEVQNSYFEKIEKEKEKRRRDFLQRRGLRFIGDKIGVNYEFCVQKNRPRVKQAVEVMSQINRNLSLHQFLALMLAFIQEVRYGIPPLKENNKSILEFWVPPKVLVNNFGDCDSKGVTFASMWSNFKRYPLILIKIPNHLFVGLAIPSFTQEGITINGLRYTLCEVTGPDKIPPGLITPYSRLYLEGGQYRYEIIR
jgi:hypothetical protein